MAAIAMERTNLIERVRGLRGAHQPGVYHGMKRAVAAIGSLLLSLLPTCWAQSPFESHPVNGLDISPSGVSLALASTSTAELAVFSLAEDRRPKETDRIPVGLDPVSVRFLSDEEIWTANRASDTVSVVSRRRGVVTHTLKAGDEPGDIAFAGTPLRAFVTSSRTNSLLVYDPSTKALLKEIPLPGEYPNAIAVGPGGRTIFIAFLLSGNGTTIVSRTAFPRPPPQPEIHGLPAAPDVALIVDSTDPQWHPGAVRFKVTDIDVAVVDAQSLEVAETFERVGTNIRNLALHPQSGSLLVANTDARNLTFYLERLKGHLVDHRISEIHLGPVRRMLLHDLNPRQGRWWASSQMVWNTALAEPTSIAIEAGGNYWVTLFGSDRIAEFDARGRQLRTIDQTPGSRRRHESKGKRGPRTIVVHPLARTAYIQNSIAETLSVLDTRRGVLTSEVAYGTRQLTDRTRKQGQELFYDSRLSPNGLSSCGSCHIDAGTDNLAWNLGSLQGRMTKVVDPESGKSFEVHPLKGPMVTQPLQGLRGHAPYHWRGDIPGLSAFTDSFSSILRSDRIRTEHAPAVESFLEAIIPHPNPYQNIDGTLPEQIDGVSVLAGLEQFTAVPSPTGSEQACASCHGLPWDRPKQRRITTSDRDPRVAKVPDLRHVYKKLSFSNRTGAVNRLGFGMSQDGAIARLGGAQVLAFLSAWDSGTHPSTGTNFTVTSENASSDTVAERLRVLARVADEEPLTLLGHGLISGKLTRVAYRNGLGSFETCAGDDATPDGARLLESIDSTDDVLTFTVHPGEARCGRVAMDKQRGGWLGCVPSCRPSDSQ
jgi:DNA-binding beta-propeller fold protein YncE